MSRLLFVSKGILKRTGGAETAAYQMLLQIIKQVNIKRIIVLTNDPKDIIKNTMIDNFSLNLLNTKSLLKKIKIYCIPLIKPRIPIFTDFLDARRFKKAIKKILKLENIDLIHIHTYSAFYITPNSWNVPTIYSFNDFPIQWPNDPYNCFPINYFERIWTSVAKSYWKIILSEKNLNRSSLYFHCNGSDSKDYLLNKGIDEQNILLLPNGYDKTKEEEEPYIETIQTKLQKLFDPQGQKLKILVVGQLNNIKNQYTLIKGFMDFSQNSKKTILLIVGRPTPFIGPFYVRKIWKKLRITSRRNIIWFGYVSNALLNELYRFTDLVVLMSHSEASPLVLGECKKMKKVMISTRVGSLRELLSKELTMLDPNSIKSLSSELEKIYFNRKTLQKYEEVMNNSELPSWDDVGKKMGEFYKTMRIQK